MVVLLLDLHHHTSESKQSILGEIVLLTAVAVGGGDDGDVLSL